MRSHIWMDPETLPVRSNGELPPVPEPDFAESYGRVCWELGDAKVRTDDAKEQMFSCWKGGRLVLTTKVFTRLLKFIREVEAQTAAAAEREASFRA